METLTNGSDAPSTNACIDNGVIEFTNIYNEAKQLTDELMRIMNPLPGGYFKQIESGDYIAMPAGLDPEIIEASLRGDISIAVKPGDFTTFAACDIDIKAEFLSDKISSKISVKLKKVLSDVVSELDLLGLKAICEDSGRRGYHVWILFDGPIPVGDARKLLEWAVHRIKLPKEISIECKPQHANDSLRLFLNINKKTGKRSTFLNSDLTAFKGDNVAFLKSIKPNPIGDIIEILEGLEVVKDVSSRFRDNPDDGLNLSQMNPCQVFKKIITDAESSKRMGHVERSTLAMLILPTNSKRLREQFIEVLRKLPNYDENVTNKHLDRMRYDRSIGCKSIAKKLDLCDGNCEAIRGMSLRSPVALLQQGDSFVTPVKIPEPYTVNSSGIFCEKKVNGFTIKIKVSDIPAYITAKTKNLDDGYHGVELTFRPTKDRPPEKINTTLRVISDAHSLLTLADYGLGSNSNTSKSHVGFFTAQYGANKESLPTKLVTRRSGWATFDGITGFFLGSTVFLPAKATGLIFEFLPSTSPGRVIVQSMGVKGSREEWISAFKRLLGFRHFVLVLGMAFAAPLVSILAIGNLIVHFRRESSKGKTTAMMGCVSVYGFPGDSTFPNSLIKQWRTTDNGLEPLAYAYNDLVLPLDEAGQADPKTLDKAQYLLTNGGGKSRALQDGEGRMTKNWCNLTLSTGEVSLLTGKTTTGQEVRLIEISKSPFDENDKDNRELVDDFRRRILENYGHAGAAYLQELVEIVNDVDRAKSFREGFDLKHKAMLQHKNSIFHARNAKHFAAMWHGLELANRLLQLFDDPHEIERIMVQLYTESGEKWATNITTIEKALRYLWDQIDAQSLRFDEGALDRLGHRVDTHNHNGAFAFFEAKLDKLLSDGGFDPKSIKDGFRDQGFVVLDKEGKLIQVRRDGKKPRAWVFHKDLAKQFFENLTEAEVAEEKAKETKFEGLK